MKNFEDVITQTLKQSCKDDYEVIMRKKNVLEIKFDKFVIVLYYSVYEYELMFDYYNPKNKKQFYLDILLLGLGCKQEEIPAFKFISNEEVMVKYVQDYLELVHKYYTELSDLDKTAKLMIR